MPGANGMAQPGIADHSLYGNICVVTYGLESFRWKMQSKRISWAQAGLFRWK
jgi:hypothetical protein